MRRKLTIGLMLCLSTLTTWAEQVVVETRNNTLVLDVVKGQ